MDESGGWLVVGREKCTCAVAGVPFCGVHPVFVQLYLTFPVGQ